MPIFGLVLAKGVPRKLAVTKSAADPQLRFSKGLLNAIGVDMPTFAKFLSEGQTGRPVVDATGLTGKYDFHWEWAPDTADPDGVSIFTALQQQIGLKLKARTAPADRMVIRRAELPSAN